MANPGLFCTNCGTRVNPSARFCVNCGTQLVEGDPTQSPEAEARGQKRIPDIIGETFLVYKRNFINFIVIVAVVQIPSSLLTWLVFVTVDFPVKALVLAILGWLAWLLMQGALIHAISEQFLGRPIQIQKSYAFARTRFLPMLGAIMVAVLALSLMAITVIGIPFAIAFLVYWFFIFQCALLEIYGPTAAMSRSHNLVRGYWWWVFGFIIVSGIFFGTIGGALIALSGSLIPFVGAIIGEILMAPLFIIPETLMYLELSARLQAAQPSDVSSNRNPP